MDKYISVKEIEEAALELLPKATRDYYKSGATEEQTLEDNKACFRRFVCSHLLLYFVNLKVLIFLLSLMIR